MWKKENDSRPEPAPRSGAPAPVPRPAAASPGGQAIIGPSIRVKGSLHGKEDLLIQGSVEGKVELEQNQVTVGSQGKVKADIVGRVIVVEGSVEGNLFGSEQVLLSSSSSVRGNITAPRVSLDDGANFKGAIDMSSAASSGSPQQRQSQGKAPQKNVDSAPGQGSGPSGGRGSGTGASQGSARGSEPAGKGPAGAPAQRPGRGPGG